MSSTTERPEEVLLESTSNEMSKGSLNSEVPRLQGHDGSPSLTNDNKNDQFLEACRHGNLRMVQELLQSGTVDVNYKGEDGLTPVLSAAWTGREDLFHMLGKHGCNLSVKLDNGNNVLHLACLGGNIGIVNFLITKTDADIESKGMFGRTALLYSAETGNKKIFDFLVQKGCDLSVVDEHKSNILHFACFSDNVDIVDYIIYNTNIHIDSRGKYGRTPVMVAAQGGNRKVFDFLVQKGCDLSVVDEYETTILHLACFSDNVDIIDYIISNTKIHIDSRGQYERTPVMFAAENGNKQVFDFLVLKGCDLSLEDEDKNNILHVACFSDNTDIVDYIISNTTIHIDSRDQYGGTPVMFAAENGTRKVFDFLVQKGCDLSLEDDDKSNILHVACFSDNVDIVDYIISNTTIHIDSRGQYGKTPVMFAAENGNRKVFDFLVEKGCELSVEDERKNNILHVASFSDNVDIVDYILSNTTIHIDSRGQYGRTPVMVAAENGHRKVFNFLVQKGCNLSDVDHDGNTVLYLAANGGNPRIVEFILTNTSVDINSRNKVGFTAAGIARLKKYIEVTSLIESFSR